MLILWETKTLKPRRKGNRRESYVMVVCPRCGQQRELTVANARVAEQRFSQCGTCQRIAAGKEGYKATVAKIGREGLLKIWAAQQLEKMPVSEQVTRDMIEELLSGSHYQIKCQHVYKKKWILDFAIFSGRNLVAIVEVNGYWHKRSNWQRDIELATVADCPTLFIDAENFETSSEATLRALDALRQFFFEHCKLSVEA